MAHKLGGKGGNKKKPNKRPGYYTYYYATRYPLNKLRRILRYNGLDAARSWADKHDAQPALRQLLNKGVFIGPYRNPKTTARRARERAARGRVHSHDTVSTGGDK